MKRLTLVLIASLTCGAFAEDNSCPAISPRAEYQVNQKYLTLGSDFNIMSRGERVGRVVQKIFRWGKTFELRNEYDQLVARARRQVVSFGTKIDVFDCADRKIGSLRENVWKSLFGIKTVYTVLDAQERVLGQSKMLDFFGTRIEFFDPNGRVNAKLTRRYFNWITDKWTLVVDGDDHPFGDVLFFAAAFKTSSDADRAAAYDGSSNDD